MKRNLAIAAFFQFVLFLFSSLLAMACGVHYFTVIVALMGMVVAVIVITGLIIASSH